MFAPCNTCRTPTIPGSPKARRRSLFTRRYSEKSTSAKFKRSCRKINSIISTATISQEDEAKLIRELEDLAKIFPLLTYALSGCNPRRRINEREKGERELAGLWKQIQEAKTEIEVLEKALSSLYERNKEKCGVAEPKLDSKQVAELKAQIEELYQEKRQFRAEYLEVEQAYCDQQTQILTAKWLAKRKQELINLRAKEAKEQKLRLGKCLELIDTCERITAKLKGGPAVQEENPQTTKDSAPGKRDGKKKKRKQKQKKAETVITALELDTLRPQFECFEVAMPKGKEELKQAVKSLHQKASEIQNKPLTETLSAYSYRGGEDSEDKGSGESPSFANSFSASVAEDLNLLEGVGE